MRDPHSMVGMGVMKRLIVTAKADLGKRRKIDWCK